MSQRRCRPSRQCHLCPPLQYKVRSLQDLVSLKDSDRRNMLRVLGEEKYDEVMAVLGSFPHITMDTKLQGGSPHTRTITVGWLTCSVTLDLFISFCLQFWTMKTAIISQLDLLSL